MATRSRTFALALGCCLAATGRAPADDAPAPDLKPLLGEVRKLVEKYYPEAKVTLKDGTIHFESDVRKFMVHEPLPTGEWQDARAEVGPKKGGIHGDIELRAGEFAGMAFVPQSFDKHYFSVSLLAPYSKKFDSHLYVRLKYPQGAPEAFLKEFSRLVEGFEAHLPAGGK